MQHLLRRLFCLAALLIAGAGNAASNAPAFYQRQAGWHDSMLSALTGIAASGLQDAFTSFESETMRGGDVPRQVSLPLSGAEDLYLSVIGMPDVKWAVADWADARLIRADGRSEKLTQAAGFTVLQGRFEKDLTLKSGLYQKLRLRGGVFESGLHVQADSLVHVALRSQYARFEATIGVDDWAGTNGSVRFSATSARSGAIKRLWAPLMRDFETAQDRQEMNWEREDRIFEFAWQPGDWTALARRYAQACFRVPPLARQAAQLAGTVQDRSGLQQLRTACYLRSRRLSEAQNNAAGFDLETLQAAIDDLRTTFPTQYSSRYQERLSALKTELGTARETFQAETLAAWENLATAYARLDTFRSEALLANPLLHFEQMLVLKRIPQGGARRTGLEGYGYGEFLGLPRQSSWNYGTMPNVDKWTNEIALLSRPSGKWTTLYKPQNTALINDLELHWNADKMLFSMPDTNRNWQIHELALSGSAPTPSPRQLTPSAHRDVHNYDPTYLPNGEILFLSTAPLQGVPCNASVIVGMMYKMGRNGERIRQLTFEQDHDYTPSVLNNGRVLYLRWDYTDTPHVWNRILMSMNPDGTGQMEYTGANSYWPNAMFYARAIPNHPTKIVTIVTGHHEGRVGELFIFDPAKGRHETDGVVQRIPKKGPPVTAKIEDKLTEHSWPKFLHPWPLSDKYFLVACKPHPDALWGIYLADTFDNLTLIKEEEGYALLEPVPVMRRTIPPIIQDKIAPTNQPALVYIEDVHSGPGLKGVPPGTIKSLRLFTYHFAYQQLAGIDHRVGADGPWEAKRVLGTVPVEADGSALFHVPAKTPISFQPLDAEGKAVALMRSWMTAMPGENVSCVGCHDRQSSAPAGTSKRLALTRPAQEITPWHGPSHGFSFARDVQPVLDQYCVGCHHGGTGTTPAALPDLRRDQGGFVVYRANQLDGQFQRGNQSSLLGKYGAVFDPSYVALRRFIRVGGLESDLHLLPPREFAADTSDLIQMLAKGHHNVKLDAEAWDRLVTWIDLNAPCHGTWAQTTTIPGDQCQRRLELRQLYGGVVENFEDSPAAAPVTPKPVMPEPEKDSPAASPAIAGWPFDGAAAKAKQAADGAITRTVSLGRGLPMEFVRIPAGRFVMGDAQGAPDERTLSVQQVEKGFWMGKCEVSNDQFAQFDAQHDSRFEHRSSWWFDQEYIGWPLNRPHQPVVRVSWEEAMAFCQWLSTKLGEEVTLPTEIQWEWACRAGTATPFSFGDATTDFSPFANLGDASLRKLADEGWRPKSPDLVAKDARFHDGFLVTAEVGHFAPNAWGLHDMHGNAAEWTATEERTGTLASMVKKVVRGGSWHDRPQLGRSASRWAYEPWQKVYNVGFRVIINPGGKRLASAP